MNKKQNIVFILGAGFSAHYNIPVMGNFISKAKDLYFSNPDKFHDLGETINLITKYASIKMYMDINLNNIEDLLSIAYMEAKLSKNKQSIDKISSFIKTVITSYQKAPDADLVHFVDFLLKCDFSITNNSIHIPYENREVYKYNIRERDHSLSHFGIISLNYDLLIENALKVIEDQYFEYYKHSQSDKPLINYFDISKSLPSSSISFAKLHGSVDTQIIPPTWDKSIEKNIFQDWKLAHSLLSKATHLIFLGFSLPPTDNYLKYLFANGLKMNNSLKKISVVTLDTNNQTKKRYMNLFNDNLTFHNLSTGIFLQKISGINSTYDFDNLDELLKI